MVVLYAEDDIEDFDVFYEVIQSIDPTIEIINGRDGAETLDILERIERLPDYIFLDINMPTMDGKSCLKAIKKDERFSPVPVIIYTTSSDPRDIALCKELGANEYIQKPNAIKDAVSVLSKFLKKGN